MESPKRILLFDLDGTLLREDKTLSRYTLEVVSKCKERGCLIGISTSRSEQNCLKFLKELKPDILISSGGALVRADKKIVCSSFFSAAETKSFIETARNICGMECEFTVDTLEVHYADIGMLKICGIGVAMGNAIQEVKDIADAITLSNEEDGVAVYLEKWIITSAHNDNVKLLQNN